MRPRRPQEHAAKIALPLHAVLAGQSKTSALRPGLVEHDERRRRRAVRGARVAARRLAPRRGRAAPVRVQRLARVRGLQPAAAAAHPGQAVQRPGAGRHPARAAAVGVPAGRAGRLRAPVPGRPHVLQPAGGAGAQVGAAVLERGGVQAVR